MRFAAQRIGRLDWYSSRHCGRKFISGSTTTIKRPRTWYRVWIDSIEKVISPGTDKFHKAENGLTVRFGSEIVAGAHWRFTLVTCAFSRLTGTGDEGWVMFARLAMKNLLLDVAPQFAAETKVQLLDCRRQYSHFAMCRHSSLLLPDHWVR